MFGATLVTTIVPNVTTGHIGDHLDLHDWFNGTGNIAVITDADYGAVDGGSAATNTAAIVAAADDIAASGVPGEVIIPPGMDFPVTPDAVSGAWSGVTFTGGGTLSTVQTTLGALITFEPGSENCGVDGVRFTSPNNEIVAVASVDTDAVTVKNCKAFGPRLWVGGTGLYAANNAANATTNATIVDNLVVATTAVNVNAAIWAYYVRGATISRNIVIDHAQGIVGWGGDADPLTGDGDLANERKATNQTVTGNIVMDSTGGGIWFSMVQGVTVSANVVSGCADVGVDFEGCSDASATGNTCTDNVGGNFTTFFHNRGVVFSANTGTWTVAGVMVRCANYTGYALNMDVEFTGNTFRSLAATSVVSVEPTAIFTFVRNVCTNVRLDTKFNNQGDTIIENNILRFDVAAGAAFHAIQIGQNHNDPRVSVCDNKVRTTVAQPAGSYAIWIEMDDPSTFPIVTIDRNDTPGWGALPIRVAHVGANIGKWCITHVGWNNLGEGTGIDRVETGAAKSVMVREGNRQHGSVPCPSAIPVAGYWDVGEEAVLTPVAGGYRRAVCVTAGSPGSWKGWGEIAP